MRQAITAALGAVTLAVPTASAAAAVTSPKAITTTAKVIGPKVAANKWGDCQVALVISKTTTTAGTKKTVKRKIVKVSVPVSPDHTFRSIFLTQGALPTLKQEVLKAQFNANIQLVSGATDTSEAFVKSLQAALLKAKKL